MAIDTSSVRVIDMELAPYFLIINSHIQPNDHVDYFQFMLEPEGVTFVSIVSLNGNVSAQFHVKKDICLITLVTKESLFIGSTHSESVNLNFDPDFGTHVPALDFYIVGGVGLPFEEYQYGLIRIIEQSNVSFIRADCNADGVLNIADAIYVESYLFLGANTPSCLNACDSNNDGHVDIADSIYSLSYMFSLGQAPAAPFPDCGLGTLANSIACPVGLCP